MELKEAIYNRRSVRIFEDREVEPEKIRRIVDAAQWAPSACNKQGWRFIAVSDKNIKEAATKNQLIRRAPLAIFVVYEKHLTEHKYSYIQSAAAAIQNMLLTAHGLGLGATWLTGIGDLEIVEKALKVPDSYEVIACVILGYPKEKPISPKRKKIEEILSFNRFDFAEGPYPFTYDVKKWPLSQIIKFREDSMRAASPLENSFSFGRSEETKKEAEFVGAEIREREKILEIMPFSGTHTLEMLKNKKFSDYHVFELSQQPVEFIKQRLVHNGISLPEFSVGGIDKLPYPDKYFDAVIVFQKLEMLPDLKILSEIRRILKPQGKLFISFKNMTGLYGLYYWYKFRFFNRDPIWNYGPFVPLNYFTVKKMLKKNFKMEKETGITPLVFVGRQANYPFSFLGRLVIFEAIARK
ncbi:MAG: nitroreductase family protein [Candidatus Tagabacteria bacterium]